MGVVTSAAYIDPLFLKLGDVSKATIMLHVIVIGSVFTAVFGLHVHAELS